MTGFYSSPLAAPDPAAVTRPSVTDARLYLCTNARAEQGDFADFVRAAYAGGVDIIQLRDKALQAAEELELLAVLSEVAAEHGKLWAVNDRADIAALSGAPVFHIGQQDLPVAAARTLLPAGTAVGLSSHTQEQVRAAAGAGTTDRSGNGGAQARAEAGGAQAPAEAGGAVDYFCVGPVWATPTKPGRAAVGLELLRYAASLHTRVPWFAIGGIDLANIEQVVAAGAQRVVVVRAITEASDPTSAAQALRAALGQGTSAGSDGVTAGAADQTGLGGQGVTA
ncbi:thiamine phosphate synthase [Paeniglutamicibacter antarcticus]|uniref:Thiamine-phosphate synthase n=1 Tax=Arthrobacter terrae TaxID=2935737 RepID=A0A931CNN2_9MICC|nr:thiamine phosphate synthase [Arthrobacter terrae]MBG0739520.1 thiamine phosphate synthase [Arthrobacter terrae]